jgi:hypothetical protein
LAGRKQYFSTHGSPSLHLRQQRLGELNPQPLFRLCGQSDTVQVLLVNVMLDVRRFGFRRRLLRGLVSAKRQYRRGECERQ